MKLPYLLTILFSMSIMYATGQTISDDERRYQLLYKENIRKSKINGVYIPKDMDEAYEELNQLASPEAIAKFKAASEDTIATRLHFGLGRWISHFWNFDEGSRYVEYLKNLGLKDKDHMVQFTIVSFHRHLNNRDQEVEKRIYEYDKIIAERLRKMKDRLEVIELDSLKK